MSDRPAGEVAAQIHELNRAAADMLGVTLEEPFMQLSFLALSVIPELRITDGGLVDVDEFDYVPVELAPR
jgi:adenine deaminase